MFFNSRRSTVHATHGIVATSQPLAAMAGLRILMDGGNAVDAAVGAAATLNVVEPMSTGAGGDLFALIWQADRRQVVALNGSGRAPAAASISDLHAKGHSRMPATGPLSVSVPGAVHGWETLLDSAGTISLAEALAPAIAYAEQGFPVSDIIAFQWQQQESKLAAYPSGQELLHNGRAPREGEMMRLPTLAGTLRAIAEGGSDAFYRGPIAKAMANFVQEQGGWLAEKDLADHRSDWDEPIKTDYRGVDCWECPPNGQGIIALEALNIVEGFDLAGMGPQSPDRYHHLIEATRLGFADAFEYLADPRCADVPVDRWIAKDYAAGRRGLIDPARAMPTAPYGKMLPGSDTVYISVIDGAGNACSLINSVFANFGSGLVAPRRRRGTAQPRRPVQCRTRTSQCPGRRQAPLPYHHSRPGHAGRRTVAFLRRDGRLHAAPRTPASHHQYGGLRVGRPGGAGRAPFPGGRGRRMAGGRCGQPGGDGTAPARPPGQCDARPAAGRRRRNGGRADCQPQPRNRRVERRQRTPQRRRGRGLVKHQR